MKVFVYMLLGLAYIPGWMIQLIKVVQGNTPSGVLPAAAGHHGMG